MYFMPTRLHITCEVNQRDYLLIHFEEKGLGGGLMGGWEGGSNIYTVLGRAYGRDNPRKINGQRR